MIRTILNRLYDASGALAAVAVVVIAGFTLAQIVGRLFSIIVPSAGDFATFGLSASSFLGLAYVLRKGEHIRVQLVLDRLGPVSRRRVEFCSLLLANLFVGYLAFYSVRLLYQTYIFGEYTLGLVPIPKWIPMTFMAVGIVVLFIALLDEFVTMLRGRNPSYFDVKKDHISQA